VITLRRFRGYTKITPKLHIRPGIAVWSSMGSFRASPFGWHGCTYGAEVCSVRVGGSRVDPVFSDPCAVSLFEGSMLCGEAVIKRMVRSYSLFSGLDEQRDDGMAGLITRISLASRGGEQVILLHHNSYLMPLDYQARRNQFPTLAQAEQRQLSQLRREQERSDRWERMLDEFERGSDPSPSCNS